MQPMWARIGVLVLFVPLLVSCARVLSLMPASRGSVAALRQDLDTLDNRVGVIEQKLVEQEARQERLEGMAVQIRDQLQSVSQAQQAFKAGLDQVGSEFQDLRERIDRLEQSAAEGAR